MSAYRLSFLAACCMAMFCSFALPVSAAEKDCSMLTDPTGDVYTSNATSGVPVRTERADILAASLVNTGDAWIFSATTVEPLVPDLKNKEQARIMLIMNRNGSSEDDYWVDGDRRAGSDLYYAFTATGSSTRPVVIGRYVVDMAALKWTQISTSSTVQEVSDSRITIRIPFSELASKERYPWRADAVIGTSKWIARDALPERSDDPENCGYMPIPSKKPDPNAPRMSIASTSTVSEGREKISIWSILSIAAAALAGVAYLAYDWTRQKKA